MRRDLALEASPGITPTLRPVTEHDAWLRESSQPRLGFRHITYGRRLFTSNVAV